MAKAYSLDLRKKVVEFISQGNKKEKLLKYLILERIPFIDGFEA